MVKIHLLEKGSAWENASLLILGYTGNINNTEAKNNFQTDFDPNEDNDNKKIGIYHIFHVINNGNTHCFVLQDQP